jgi:hypothetical protein
MKKPDNPFITNGYFGKEYFCDRENELSKLHQMLKNDTNYLLISRRKLGKTALIERFFEEISAKKETICIFVDLFATQDMHDFILQFTSSVYAVLKAHKPLLKQLIAFLQSLRVSISYDSLSGLPEFRLQFAPQQPIENTLHGLMIFLENQNHKIIVAFDEFQQIAEYPEKNMEAQLRTLIQKMHHVQFIFSGSDQRIISELFFNQKRPFYNSTANIVLDKIEKEEYIYFVDYHFNKNKKNINREALDFIFEWTQTHTYYVQYVCKNCFDFPKKNVSIEDVQIVCKDILSQNESIYQQYRKLLTSNQWKLLIAIAKEEMLVKPTSSDFLKKHLFGSASSVKLALNSLLDKRLIISTISQDEEIYLIDDVFFMRYLQYKY